MATCNLEWKILDVDTKEITKSLFGERFQAFLQYKTKRGIQSEKEAFEKWTNEDDPTEFDDSAQRKKICKYCTTQFSKSNLLHHSDSCIGKMTFNFLLGMEMPGRSSCQDCDKIYLRKNEKMHKCRKSDKGKLVKCIYCGFNFKSHLKCKVKEAVMIIKKEMQCGTEDINIELMTRLELQELAQQENKSIEKLKEWMRRKRNTQMTKDMIASYREEMAFIDQILSESGESSVGNGDMEIHPISFERLVKNAKRKERPITQEKKIEKILAQEEEERNVIARNRFLRLSEMRPEILEMEMEICAKLRKDQIEEEERSKEASRIKEEEESKEFARLMNETQKKKHTEDPDPKQLEELKETTDKIKKLEEDLTRLHAMKEKIDGDVRLEEMEWFRAGLDESQCGKAALKSWNELSRFNDWRQDEYTFLRSSYICIFGEPNKEEFVSSVLNGNMDPKKFFVSQKKSEWLSAIYQIKDTLKIMYNKMETLPNLNLNPISCPSPDDTHPDKSIPHGNKYGRPYIINFIGRKRQPSKKDEEKVERKPEKRVVNPIIVQKEREIEEFMISNGKLALKRAMEIKDEETVEFCKKLNKMYEELDEILSKKPVQKLTTIMKKTKLHSTPILKLREALGVFNAQDNCNIMAIDKLPTTKKKAGMI